MSASLGTSAVVIDSFSLVDATGQKHLIIEPDKKIDTAEEYFELSFVNNGRVPAMQALNFELVYSDKDLKGQIRRFQLTSTHSLTPPLTIRKNSFIHLELKTRYQQALDPMKTLESIELVVDDETVKLDADAILKTAIEGLSQEHSWR